MIGNISDNTTALYIIKYTFGEIFSSGGATLCKNPSDQTVTSFDQPVGRNLTRKGLLGELQVRFNFIKVMQNSSRLTNVSRLGNIELVTPTLLT